MGKILRVSLRRNFTPNTLGCYGLKYLLHAINLESKQIQSLVNFSFIRVLVGNELVGPTTSLPVFSFSVKLLNCSASCNSEKPFTCPEMSCAIFAVSSLLLSRAPSSRTPPFLQDI